MAAHADRIGEAPPPSDPHDADLAFSSRRSIAPMLWAMIVLGMAELAVVHLMLALLWSGRAALALTLVALFALGWLAAAIRSLDTHPTKVGRDRLVLRAGRLKAIEIARADVAGMRDGFTGAEVKARDTLNLGLLAYPNVMVELARPAAWRRRRIARVALKLDDPAGFIAALSEAGAAR